MQHELTREDEIGIGNWGQNSERWVVMKLRKQVRAEVGFAAATTTINDKVKAAHSTSHILKPLP